MWAQVIPDPAQVKQWTDNFGTTVVVLVVFVVLLVMSIIMVVRWLKPRAEKIIDSHLETLETFRTNDTERTRSLGVQADSLHTLSQLQGESAARLADIAKLQQEQNVKMDQHAAKIDALVKSTEELHESLERSVLVRTESVAIHPTKPGSERRRRPPPNGGQHRPQEDPRDDPPRR